MSDHAAAEECVKAYDQSYLGGKQIKVQEKKPRSSSRTTASVGKTATRGATTVERWVTSRESATPVAWVQVRGSR